MLTPLGYVLLAAASAVLGVGSFWLGRRSATPSRPHTSLNLHQRYLAGFTQLLKEQPDAATEAFVSALDVNPETLETHIAFGEMLRRRGEVDKAIRVHQNAMSQPSLPRAGAEQVQLALALDYKQAGLLDRAEVLLRELNGAADKAVGSTALEALLEVLQLEREWPAAIEVAGSLASRKRGDEVARLKLLQAQFACEQAEIAKQQGSMQNYLHWTHEALRFAPKHPRPLINLARWDMAQGAPQAAIQKLKDVHQHPELLPELVPLLERAYRATGREQEYCQLLSEMTETHGSGAVLLKWADLVAVSDPEKSVEGLRTKAARTRDFAPVSGLLELLPATVSAPRLIKALSSQLCPAFACEHCGFSSQKFYWRCPTCNTWL